MDQNTTSHQTGLRDNILTFEGVEEKLIYINFFSFCNNEVVSSNFIFSKTSQQYCCQIAIRNKKLFLVKIINSFTFKENNVNVHEKCIQPTL